MKVTFIGAGNIATNLSTFFLRKGHRIDQVISRTASSASSLAKTLHCNFTTDLNEVNPQSDLYFICVSDIAISEVVKALPPLNGIVLHTSGSTALNVFGTKFKHTGAFYPLQTFSRFKTIELTDIPLFLEASDNETEKKIKLFSESIFSQIHFINSEQRMALHICGIFANNFTNHMYAICYQLAKDYQIPFTYFFPIIRETAEKIEQRSPITSQTGPASRKDKHIIENHLRFLNDKAGIKELYKILSESIIKFSR